MYKATYAETDIEYKTYKPVEIRISPELAKYSKMVIISLIHEMCHVSNAVKYKRICSHGPKFVKELERVLKAGAFTRFNGGVL